MYSVRSFIGNLRDNFVGDLQREIQNLKLNLSWLSNRLLTTDILTISLTKKCNLNCTYCWDYNQRERLNELETEEIKKLLISAKKQGVRSFNPFGGEPFIRKDAVEIIEFALSLGFRVTVTTNGTLVNEEKLRRLLAVVKHGPELCILVSLDGCTAEENDFIRSPGSFVKTTWTIRRLNELRKELNKPISIIVNTVVSKNNYRSVTKQIDLVRELGADLIHFITPIVNGGEVGNAMKEQNLFLLPEDFEELDRYIDQVIEIKRKDTIILNNEFSLENFKSFYRRQYEQHKSIINT